MTTAMSDLLKEKRQSKTPEKLDCLIQARESSEFLNKLQSRVHKVQGHPVSWSQIIRVALRRFYRDLGSK